MDGPQHVLTQPEESHGADRTEACRDSSYDAPGNSLTAADQSAIGPRLFTRRSATHRHPLMSEPSSTLPEKARGARVRKPSRARSQQWFGVG